MDGKKEQKPKHQPLGIVFKPADYKYLKRILNSLPYH